MRLWQLILWVVVLGSTLRGRADDARFDLNGPHIDVYVTRAGITLPIAQVPNLIANDLLRIKADLPAAQSNHLLLIVAFLRDATNEPRDDWFTKIETWKEAPAEGTVIAVPEGAAEALLFVAPETGGDFATLRSAVKGNPGTFIRASRSLNKASLEQQRIERYLTGMQSVAEDDAKVIAALSAKLASSLALKPNADCFKQPVEDQVDCLTQASTPLLLDDGHKQTAADVISSGASSSFINEASTADGGTYSAYVGTLVDLVHLVEGLHTAQYRYIPAISFPEGPTLNLKLNAAPSFINPKSVIVIALPAVGAVKLPAVELANAAQVFCLMDPVLTLPLRGSPLALSSGFGHDLTLEVGGKRLPLMADAVAGGLVVSGGAPARGDGKGSSLQGRLRGYWGFDAFDGPTLALDKGGDGGWDVGGRESFVAGAMAHLTLRGNGVGCVRKSTLVNDGRVSEAVTLGTAVAGVLPLDVSLKGHAPGEYSLVVEQYGGGAAVRLPLTAYDGAIQFEHVVAHPNDRTALLVGQGVEKVASVEMAGLVFLPYGPGGDGKSLQVRASSGASVVGGADAIVTLKNGRTLPVAVVTEETSAELHLLSLEDKPNDGKDAVEITMTGTSDLPLHGMLHFVVESAGAFPHTQTIEIATEDGAARAVLSVGSSSLILQDEHTVVGTLDLAKAFGESAFGLLRLRAVPVDGTPGEWMTLGRLVRRPVIRGVRCSHVGGEVCAIEGSNLFLAESFSGTESFETATPVPSGFDGSSLVVPMKAPAPGRTIYVRLRDDPEAVGVIRVPEKWERP